MLFSIPKNLDNKNILEMEKVVVLEILSYLFHKKKLAPVPVVTYMAAIADPLKNGFRGPWH